MPFRTVAACRTIVVPRFVGRLLVRLNVLSCVRGRFGQLRHERPLIGAAPRLHVAAGTLVVIRIAWLRVVAGTDLALRLL
jgi:hypothetical protein